MQSKKGGFGFVRVLNVTRKGVLDELDQKGIGTIQRKKVSMAPAQG